MTLIKLSRWHLAIFIACIFLFFQLIETSLFNDTVKFPSFRPFFGKSSASLDPTLVNFSSVDHPTSDQPLPLTITNNKVTYPRLSSIGPSHSEYVDQAKIQLQRIESVRSILFNGTDLNDGMITRLISYLRRAESDKNYVPPKVVLSPWHWVPCALGQCTTGEVQWVRPLIEVMKQHDIIYFFAPWQRFRQDWKLLGDDLVTHVWADDEQVVWCFADPDKCLKTDKNPNGVPPWKLFAFTFWGSKPYSLKWGSKSEPYSFNPLGSEWNLVPYRMPEKQFYLGYHFQGCQSLEYVPLDKRDNKIVILAKRSNYFYHFAMQYPKSFFAELRNHTGFDIITNAIETEGYPIPEGLHSIGILPQEEYDRLLASAKALLGVGQPLVSPTPYAGLCRGVPVVLPYNGKVVLKHNNKTCGPQPRSDEWCGFLEESHQHGPASALGPPYVYTVDINSPVKDILEVIDTAVKTPIEPFEPPEMMHQAVEKRLLDYFAIDWERFAKDRIKERGSNKLILPDFLQKWAKSHHDESV